MVLGIVLSWCWGLSRFVCLASKMGDHPIHFLSYLFRCTCVGVGVCALLDRGDMCSQGDAVLTNLEVLDGRYSDSFARHLVVSDLRLLSDNDLQVFD